MNSSTSTPPQIALQTSQGKKTRRFLSLKTLLTWHWISSAFCLIGMILFAFTGITLNHASQIEAQAKTTKYENTLPNAILNDLKKHVASLDNIAIKNRETNVPKNVSQWLYNTWAIKVTNAVPEWSKEELYIALPRPGGDAWIRVDLNTGKAEFEKTTRGWIALLNDLHKGRNTGLVWQVFLDIFSIACLLFSITGLLILKFHASNRPKTWPIVGSGVIIPLILAILFIH